MPTFSKRSNSKLLTCNPHLQYIARKAIQIIDFSVIWGYRDEESQNKAYAEGNSNLRFPHSKHNSYPAQAFDFAPYPIDWEDIDRFIYVGGIIRGIAHEVGIRVRWGADWDSDGQLKDERKLRDFGHVELLEE
jgi:peptidoglycan L-alanyl-D-glutamate endopeptidase CwlK